MPRYPVEVQGTSIEETLNQVKYALAGQRVRNIRIDITKGICHTNPPEYSYPLWFATVNEFNPFNGEIVPPRKGV